MFKYLLTLSLISTVALAGFLQNADHATQAEIEAASGSASQLLNSSKIWDNARTQLLNTTLSTFQASGSYITSLTNDVTASGPGAASATIANSAVTNAKMANMANQTLKSNISGGAAAPSDNSLSAILDNILSSTQGSVIYRGAGSWSALSPGVSGQFLKTQGAAADPLWATASSLVSPLTTKGDLWGFSTVDARLPVGTNGQLLSANSAVALGVEWIAAPTSGINQLTGDVTAGPGTGSQAATISANAVTDTKLRDSAALSVIGRASNSSGDPADIAAAADFEVLRRSGTSIGFGTVAVGGLADSIFNDLTEVTATSLDFAVIADQSDSGNKKKVSVQSILNLVPGVSEVAWSGFHGNDCSWARTNTAYGDPAVDATCTFTESVNQGFGTVTSYLSGSDKLPGITFTPARTGRYYVCATPKFAGSVLAEYLDLKLWDGTNTIHEIEQQVFVASNIQSEAMCGIIDINSTASRSIRIQTKATGVSSITIAANSTNRSSLEWAIYALNGGSAGSWTAYTPTFGAGLGTPTSVSFFYRKTGDTLQVRGSLITGTVAASLSSISLPTGIVIDSSKVTRSNTTADPGEKIGTITSDNPNEYVLMVTATGTSTSVVYHGLGVTQASKLRPSNGSAALNSSTLHSVEFEVPVQ